MRLKSEKQEKFVQLYAQLGNASEAYRQAGYKCGTDGSVRAQASQLLAKSNIQERLRELHEEADCEAIADIQEMQAILTQIIREELTEEVLMNKGQGDGYSEIVSKRKKAALKDRLRAIELLTKMQGGFIDNINVTGGVPITFVDDLSSPD